MINGDEIFNICKVPASTFVSSPTDATSPRILAFLAVDPTTAMCKRSRDERNIAVRKRGREKKGAEISRDCGNEGESCGGNGERTRETTDGDAGRDGI